MNSVGVVVVVDGVQDHNLIMDLVVVLGLHGVVDNQVSKEEGLEGQVVDLCKEVRDPHLVEIGGLSHRGINKW